MNRERTLAAGVAATLVVVATVAALVPGVLANPSADDDVRRGFVDVREMNIGHGTVGGETVPLTVEARLDHRGGPAENVTVLFRAVSLSTGFVETSEEVAVGTVEGEREVPVEATLSVPREGGYRIEAVVFQDDQRRAVGHKEVRGVGTLQPAYAESSVAFHQFGVGENDLPVIEYSIDRADENRTTLAVETYLTNRGDGSSEDLRLVVKARQADSNIVAAEREVEVGAIRPGRTATPRTSLTVPSNYNYYLDAVLWKDGVIVGTARSTANLDPTETIRVNETRREIGLEVGDFERGDGTDSGGVEATPEPTRTSGAQGPGFGIGAALVAVLLSLLVIARNGDRND